jgi:hypothetical protein
MEMRTRNKAYGIIKANRSKFAIFTEESGVVGKLICLVKDDSY